MPLADSMQEATRLLHDRAEHTVIVAEPIAGRASMPGYLVMLRNLMPACEALEAGLTTHAKAPGLVDDVSIRRTAVPEAPPRRAG